MILEMVLKDYIFCKCESFEQNNYNKYFIKKLYLFICLPISFCFTVYITGKKVHMWQKMCWSTIGILSFQKLYFIMTG